MKECKRCGHKKTWEGSDISCPFQFSEKFGDNWNCGIIGRIRGLKGNGVHLEQAFDNTYLTINISDIDDINGDPIGMCLWVCWYKRRGATSVMWILSGDNPPQQPTFDQLEKILEFYKA